MKLSTKINIGIGLTIVALWISSSIRNSNESNKEAKKKIYQMLTEIKHDRSLRERFTFKPTNDPVINKACAVTICKLTLKERKYGDNFTKGQLDYIENNLEEFILDIFSDLDIPN